MSFMSLNFFGFSISYEIYLLYLYIGLYSMSNIFSYPLYNIHTYKSWYIFSIYVQNILAEEYFCYNHNFYKKEICQYCKKVCSGERGLSLHMYHSIDCFQKLTDISKKNHNYSLIHREVNKSIPVNQKIPKVQYATHQNKK